MPGAIAKAEELCRESPERFVPMRQFENPANPAIHEATTGPEIWEDTDGAVDVFVAGVGTGGTITGVIALPQEDAGQGDRRRGASSPTASPVITQTLAGEPLKPAPHKIQGIGAGFVPKNLDLALVDRIEQVSNEEAIATARRLAREEGILVGISCGAAMAAALRLAHSIRRSPARRSWWCCPTPASATSPAPSSRGCSPRSRGPRPCRWGSDGDSAGEKATGDRPRRAWSTGWSRATGPTPAASTSTAATCRRAQEIHEIVDLLFELFYPGYFGRQDLTDENLPFHVGNLLSTLREKLERQIETCMCFARETRGPRLGDLRQGGPARRRDAARTSSRGSATG